MKNLRELFLCWGNNHKWGKWVQTIDVSAGEQTFSKKCKRCGKVQSWGIKSKPIDKS